MYRFSEMFASGLTPAIATALLAIAGGTPWLLVGYVVAVTFVSLASVYVLPETYCKDIIPIAETQRQGTEPVREG